MRYQAPLSSLPWTSPSSQKIPWIIWGTTQQRWPDFQPPLVPLPFLLVVHRARARGRPRPDGERPGPAERRRHRPGRLSRHGRGVLGAAAVGREHRRSSWSVECGALKAHLFLEAWHLLLLASCYY